MTPNILAALAAAIVFVFILWLLRRGVLKEKYAVLWLFVSAVAAFLALVPGAMRWLADLVGVEIPANLLFFVTLVLLILVSVQLSYELSRHEAKIRRMAEEFALLEERVRGLEEGVRRVEEHDPQIEEHDPQIEEHDPQIEEHQDETEH